MRLSAQIAMFLGLALFTGCSSSSTVAQGDSGAAADTEAGADAGDAGASVSLKAPVITMVMQMSGGLHVMWTNNQPDCDAIEGERKSPTEAYALAFSVPDGTVDNKHDAPLTAGTKYTYRLRCKKGADYSPYSNEMSGVP